ncbi:MAG: potassium transporter TrkG [Planctomycetota bacterium]
MRHLWTWRRVGGERRRDRARRLYHDFRSGRLTPAQLFAATFLGLVVVGTLGFKTLPGLYADGAEPLSWLDALFTATSAVCVTGLIVVDTATHFSKLGQLYVLFLVQLGGLGMIGLASFVIITFRARLSLRQDAIASGGAALGASNNVKTRNLVRDVLLFTFLAEAAGFMILLFLWRNDFPLGEAAWHALFQSVSAFCNAGFSTFSDSLVGFQDRPATLLAISGGIITGGIGFLTLEELKQYVRSWRRKKKVRLSLHTRIVLVTTAVLLVGGAVVLGPLEWGNPRTLGGLNPFDAAINALFMSVTARTAGFNTIDYGQTFQATNFATILLMSIGGAPGGTAGGIKVTTLAVLVVMAYSRFQARGTTNVWDRTIPPVTSQRAVGLFAFSLSILALGVMLFAIVELDQSFVGVYPDGTRINDGRADFLDVMFEAVSAFNTVGLSTGPTADLSPAGRLLTIFLMFVGRVGPLTIAAALSHNAATGRGIKRFAHEDVVVG